MVNRFSEWANVRRSVGYESLNSVIRKSVKTRKLFPRDDAASKVVYLVIQAASKKWTMPIRDWNPALNRFMIVFEEQLSRHV